MKKLYIFCLTACTLVACKPKLDPVVPDKGRLNLARYLAVGNSLTAGYTDGTLTRNGQTNSYPNMLATQFALVGGGDFKQPLLPGKDGWPNPKYVLAMHKGPCDTAFSLTPQLYPGAPDSAGSSDNISLDGPFNNTGIPGIRCIDYLTPGYATVNPYAKRFFGNPLARPIDEMVRINPTFFSLWIGANDVLQYATGGAEVFNQLSKTEDFNAMYDSVMTILTRKGAKGVSMNIPDITGIPFFTTIPANGLMLTKRQSDDLNVAYNGTPIHFKEGANYFVIKDGATVRQMHDGELVLLTLPLDSVKCIGWGSKTGIPGQYILTQTEMDKIRTATTEFNNIIKTINARHDIPVVDIYSYFNSIKQPGGIAYNGVNYTTQFATGSLFSLDGIHPTARGYALVANQILMAINNYYGSTLPMVDPNKYPGIQIP